MYNNKNSRLLCLISLIFSDENEFRHCFNGLIPYDGDESLHHVRVQRNQNGKHKHNMQISGLQ